jgi:signal transduction histidine kinase
VKIQIADTGVGIPNDQIDKLFDRYYRVPGSDERYGGTGLGLTIARRIVQNHSGEISIESKLGEGSVFTVWLPSGTET